MLQQRSLSGDAASNAQQHLQALSSFAAVTPLQLTASLEVVQGTGKAGAAGGKAGRADAKSGGDASRAADGHLALLQGDISTCLRAQFGTGQVRRLHHACALWRHATAWQTRAGHVWRAREAAHGVLAAVVLLLLLAAGAGAAGDAAAGALCEGRHVAGVR
jgi:hypothetical protein